MYLSLFAGFQVSYMHAISVYFLLLKEASYKEILMG